MKNEEKKLSRKDKFMIGGLAVLSVGFGVAYTSTNHKLNLSRLEIENLRIENVEIKERLNRVENVLVNTNLLDTMFDHFTRMKSSWATKVDNRQHRVKLGKGLDIVGAGLLEVAEDRYNETCKWMDDTKELIELFK